MAANRWKQSLLPLAAALAMACSGSQSPAGATGPNAAGAAQGAPAAPPTLVTEVEGISEYRLDNGLRVLLFPDASQATVTVNVTYFVGSRHEGYGEAGMAHLLEHMVFKGTPTHADIWKLLDQRGAHFNGTTWTDRTNYYETLPATGDNLEFALSLEADRMVNSTIDPEQLAKEFSVVRNEFEMGENSPTAVLEERMYSAAFLWHNYGKSTIGNRSDIERVPADRLRRFYERFYQPDNAMLVIAGRFDTDKALEQVAATFGAIPRPERSLPPTYTVEPIQDGEREVTLRRVGDVSVVGVLYHAVPGSHEDFTAAEALVHLLTSQPSGRLYKALVESGSAARVWGGAYAWAEPGVVQFFAEVPKGKPVLPVRDTMIDILEGLDDVSADEVARFVSQKKRDIGLSMTESQRIAIELSEWAAMGDWRLFFVHRDRVESLDQERVQRFAASYLKRANRTTGVFLPTEAPQRAPLPELPNVAAVVKDYQGREAMAEGEAFEATVANVESRTERAEIGGLQVALLPKETRGDAVRVVITLRFGNEKSLTGKSAIAAMVPPMLMRGTAERSYQEIKDELSRLSAEVHFGGGGMVGGGPGQTAATITTTREHLPEVLRLVSEIFREPAFPKAEFAVVKKDRITQLEQQRQDPMARGFTTLFSALSPWPASNIRHVQSVDEQIADARKVTLPQLKRFHRAYWGATNAQVTVVGDFDRATIGSVLEETLGGWKSPTKFERIDSPFKASRIIDETIDTPDKKMAMVAVGHTIQMRDDHPDYPALEIAGFILAGSTSSRLLDRLRQKEGLSYGAFGGVVANALDDSGGFFAAAICAPESADKAMTLMLEEVQALVDRGVTDDELADAVQAYKEQQSTNLASDDYLASTLNQHLFHKRTLQFQEQLQQAIAELGADEVNAAIRKYLEPSKLAKVKAGDLSAAVKATSGTSAESAKPAN